MKIQYAYIFESNPPRCARICAPSLARSLSPLKTPFVPPAQTATRHSAIEVRNGTTRALVAVSDFSSPCHMVYSRALFSSEPREHTISLLLKRHARGWPTHA